MPRKPLIRSAALPYHVTCRSNNREKFHAPLDIVWEVLTYHCFEATVLWKVKVHALVLMPNHFHLLISTPEHDLGIVMERFMRSVTKTLNRISERSGRVFGGPYHWTLIDSEAYFAYALKYVYRNPVRARICERVEDYRYSTLQSQTGRARPELPLAYPFGLSYYPAVPSGFEHGLNWMNEPFGTERELAIQKALRRTRFSPSLKDLRVLAKR